MADLLRRIPNWLTYFRLLLVPVLVFLMNDPSRKMLLWAAAVFALASITDYFDGFLARRYKWVSDTGTLLDPLADKILVAAALIMLVAQCGTTGDTWVPAWMVVLLLAREFWVTGLRAVAASQGTIVAADTIGKWKSGLQMVAILLLIIHYPIDFSGINLDFRIMGIWLLGLSLALSLWSGVQYSLRILCAGDRSQG